MAKQEQVLVRIRRMGANWATCGIGVRPPEHLIGSPQIKYLCPKLVPGQVLAVPRTHPILRNSKLVEIVAAPEPDEFIRPWVFASTEAAAMADPSLSHLSASQIRDGLNLTSGAVDNRREAYEERSRSVGERAEDFDEGDEDDEATKPLLDENAARSRNRVKSDIYEDAKPVSDDEPEEEQPVPSRRRRRASR